MCKCSFPKTVQKYKNANTNTRHLKPKTKKNLNSTNNGYLYYHLIALKKYICGINF